MTRCKYCNEVQFKDSHKEEDCAMNLNNILIKEGDFLRKVADANDQKIAAKDENGENE